MESAAVKKTQSKNMDETTVKFELNALLPKEITWHSNKDKIRNQIICDL